jgi:tRNA threonylcarbamoyladenosine biosynthesis protein TsaB
MKILAIETATAASSVALGEGASLRELAVHVDRRGHIGFLVPAIDSCFAQAGWSVDDLDLVAVDVGPGMFSGIRAGIATAQGIAAAVGVPVIGVTSLTLLAMRAATGRRRIWPVIDVRRGQVATSPFRALPGGVVSDGAAELVSPEDLRAMIDSEGFDALVVGDVDVLPGGFFEGLHRVKRGGPRYPSADVILDYANLSAARADFSPSEEIRPVYMREPDARINWAEFREEGIWPGATP